MHIITTTNEIETYYSFLPSSYQSWKKMFPDCVYVLGFISDKEEDDPFVQKVKKHCDKFYQFKSLKDISSGVQAKTTRMYLSTLFEDNICLITDIDYYLLNKNWFLEKIKPTLENNKFTTIGHNGYFNTPDSGKWPMYFNIATSKNFKKIINPDNLNYENWLNVYRKIQDPIDNKESVSNVFNRFSDESLFRYIVYKHKDKEFIKDIWVKQEMEGFSNYKSRKRIDRSWWKQSCRVDKMESGEYIDCFPLRPFNKKNFNYIKPVLDFLNLNTDSDKIFL